MQINKKYLFLSLVAVMAVLGMSFGTSSFAQTVTPVNCSVSSSSVGVNQAALLTASGGNGTYFWSGQNLNVTNSAGTQFAVSYPTAGNYVVNVSSGGQSDSCSIDVTSSTSSGSLSCSPAVQTVMLGQTASFSAVGGDGAYVWSSPDLSITNPTGSGFSANYASAGLKTLTVRSEDGSVATCAVNVLGGVVTPPITPGFPNTGGGFGQ